MKGSSVIYQGRQVPIEGFRVFVYDRDGNKKLVNSWPSYQVALASGLWFSTSEDAQKIDAPVSPEITILEGSIEEAIEPSKQSEQSIEVENDPAPVAEIKSLF